MRVAPGHERADQLIGTNVGLTLQATRQAITERAAACGGSNSKATLG